jgi:hypothetical protein
MFCEYYEALVLKEKTWFLSACFRNEPDIAFARAIKGIPEIFEFFVPKDQEEDFLRLMKELEQMGIIYRFEKKPNRLIDPSSVV